MITPETEVRAITAYAKRGSRISCRRQRQLNQMSEVVGQPAWLSYDSAWNFFEDVEDDLQVAPAHFASDLKHAK